MSKYYTIKITGGTSPGPYTIYLSSNLITVATRYPQLTPASNLSYTELSTGLGIDVIVPDDTSTLFLYNTYSGCLSGITLIPTTTITYKDFCLRTIIRNIGPSLIRFLRFSPNTPINGYPSWIEESDSTITVTYNVTESRWKVNGFSLGSGSIVDNVSPTTANPPNNWIAEGNPAGSGVQYLSKCDSPILGRSTSPVSINQPTCLCDGSIIFNVNLDNPPYSYSIDNGVTYSSSPIFTNLCSGIYILSVVDSLGETFSDTITLNKPEMATTYSILLNTNISTPVSNELSLVKSYETTIQVIPPLPDGATITFDLIHTNSFYSSPTSGTSVLTTGTVLNKNVTPITIGSTITGQTQSVNTTPGCQSDFIYQSNIDDTWNSLTLTNTDTITISTTTRVDKTTTGLCVVGYSNDSYSISNAVISGCDCCSLIVNT
jgi:hypothetical protein